MTFTVHEQLGLTLYHINTSPYTTLRLVHVRYPVWIASHVLTGALRTETRGLSWAVGSGDVMLHPPHLAFSEQASGPGTHQWLAFDVTVGPLVDLFRLFAVAPVVALRDPDQFARTFAALEDAWTLTSPAVRPLRVMALTTHLFSQLLESWEALGSPPRPPELHAPQDRFVETIAYMSERLDAKLTREELAARIHLHPGSFDRAFRASYGIAPMRMLRDLRVQRARQLLENTDYPLTQIARTCGLGDAAYLSRVFHARLGVAPGAYRERAKNTRTGYIPQL